MVHNRLHRSRISAAAVAGGGSRKAIFLWATIFSARAVLCSAWLLAATSFSERSTQVFGKSGVISFDLGFIGNDWKSSRSKSSSSSVWAAASRGGVAFEQVPSMSIATNNRLQGPGDYIIRVDTDETTRALVNK